MIGFITDPETAATVLEGIREAQISRGYPYYWTTGSMPVYSADDGISVGDVFIPASDDILDTPLRQGLTPRDFPEFDELVGLLGGLDARVDIDPDILINPDLPPEL